MFQRLKRYQHQFNSYDALKIFALLTMIIDHIGQFILGSVEGDNVLFSFPLRIIGRFAAPIFFYLVGYNVAQRDGRLPPLNMRVWRNWLSPPLNLIPLGLILSITMYACNDNPFYLNILISLFVVRQLLGWMCPKHWKTIPIIFVTTLLVFFDYNFVISAHMEGFLLGLQFAIGATLVSAGRRVLAGFVLMVAIAMVATFNFDYTEFFLLIYNKGFSAIPHADYMNSHAIPMAAVEQIVLWVILTFFKLKDIKVPDWSRTFLLFCSHYTLEIYFAHYFVLILYAYYYGIVI